ncbi:MAG: N-acetylglucosamine kinase [Planctomycetota bacterium]
MASLGLDIGGSKCRYQWWTTSDASDASDASAPDASAPDASAGSDASGETFGAGGDAEAAQPAVDGADAAVAAIAAAIAKARGERGADASNPPKAIVCAVAGVGNPSLRADVERGLRLAVPDAPLYVVGDTLAAAAAGLREGPGLLLWSGTGSFCVARSESGELLRAGGRGYAFGDEGSGYDLVRRAIIAVLQAVDGRGPETVLRESLTAAFGAPSAERLGAVAQSLPPRAVAAQLPVVIEAFDADDRVATDVLIQGMHQLVQLADATARRAGLHDLLRRPTECSVAFGGGVFDNAPSLRQGALRLLQAAFGGGAAPTDEANGSAWSVREMPPHAAATGAAWLADGVANDLQPQQTWVHRVAL